MPAQIRKGTQKNIFQRLYPSLNVRLTVPFLILIVIIAAIGVFIATRLVAGSIQERINNQLLDSVTSTNSTLATIETDLLADLRQMVFTDGIVPALQAEDSDALNNRLRPIAANSDLYEVIVFNAKGDSLFHIQQSENGYQDIPAANIADRPGIQRVLRGEVDVLGDKFIDMIELEDQWQVYFNAPIQQEGVVIGGISVGIPLDSVAQRASQQALSSVTFYNMQGEVLSSTLRAEDLSPIRMDLLDILRFQQTIADGSTPLSEIALDGTPYQFLFAPLLIRSQDIGLMGVALPADYVTDRIGTSRDIFAVLFLFMAGVVLVLGYIVSRSVINPVQKLVETTRAIRSGDLRRRVDLTTPDELGELGQSFDDMTEDLVKQQRQIKKQYLQQLQQTAQRDAVFKSITDALIVTDYKGDLILQNHAAEGLNSRLFSQPNEYEKYLEILGNPASVTEPTLIRLGEGHFSALSTPVHAKDDTILGSVIVFRDVTAIMAAEKLKDDLILQLSHELRTPLTASMGYIDLLLMLNRESLNEQSVDFINKTSKQLGTLERMVNHVIDVSAILANEFELEMSQINLCSLLHHVVTAHKEAVTAANLRLSILMPEQEIWLEGDETRIGQVVEHLLRNAYTYTLPGGWIEISAAQEGDTVLITFVDSGVGIAADEHEKVFGRMYRGKSAEAGPTDSRGLGLGLYLTKEIVEAHRGTIELDSQQDFGTIISVRLPISQAKRDD